MASIPRPQLNRIPGSGMPLAKKEIYVKELNKLTQVELMEVKERQEKLLQNKNKLQKLPDKGKRIQDFYDKVLMELEKRSNVDEAAKLFSNLNIATQGQKTLNELEWQGNLNNLQDNGDPLEDVLDSDDENDIDPLRIIAQRQMHEKKVKIEQPEVKLITEDDLREIQSFTSDSPDSGVAGESIAEDLTPSSVVGAEIIAIDLKEKLNSIKPKLQSLSLNSTNDESRCSSAGSQNLDLDPHVHYLVDKTETQVHPAQREKFKPYRTTVSNVHDPERERQRKQGKHWEVTAATPPPIQHNGTQLLTLMDSVEIQAQYLTKLKNLHEKQAAERLANKIKRLETRKIELPPTEELKTKSSFLNYRNTSTISHTHHIEGEQKFHDIDEVHDPLDVEKSSGVNYTIYE